MIVVLRIIIHQLTGKDFGEVKMDTPCHPPRKAAFQVLCWIERIQNLFVWDRTKLNCLNEKVKTVQYQRNQLSYVLIGERGAGVIHERDLLKQ